MPRLAESPPPALLVALAVIGALPFLADSLATSAIESAQRYSIWSQFAIPWTTNGVAPLYVGAPDGIRIMFKGNVSARQVAFTLDEAFPPISEPAQRVRPIRFRATLRAIRAGG